MRVVITGSSKAASFQIRGRQLGRAIGATVVLDAPLRVLSLADVVIAVKRIPPQLAAVLRACGRPVVWDALDFFEQTTPAPRSALVADARRRAASINAKAIIGATRRMADDLGSPYSLVHHGWERGVIPIRERLGVVAYEGAAAYLGDARAWLTRACEKRGACFVMNPVNYLMADVVVAMRAGPYDTYATRNWKSGLKLSNAQVAGVPFVGRNEAGYLEQASGGELWAEDEAAFGMMLDVLADPLERRWRREMMLGVAPRLPFVAANLTRILEAVMADANCPASGS
jgi:hypothetical protein